MNYQQINPNNLLNSQLYSNTNLSLNPNLINNNGINLNNGYLNLNSNPINQINNMNNSFNSNMSQNKSTVNSYSSVNTSKEKKNGISDFINEPYNNLVKLSQILDKSIWININKKKKAKKDDKEQKENKDSIDDSELHFNGDSPSKRWGHSCCVYKNKMIIFGGRFNSKSLNSMYIFDLETLSWNKIDCKGNSTGSNNIPTARDSHTSLVYKNFMYVFGGNWQDKKLNDLWRLNLDDYT